MNSWESSPVVMVIMLVVVGIAAVCVSLWRVLQGSPAQRARGIMSLLPIGASIAAFLWVLHAMGQIGGGNIGGPGPNAPAFPTGPSIPSYATPPDGISAP